MNLNLYQHFIACLTGKRLFLSMGSAFADGTQAGRTADERHAFLAYVWDKGEAVPNRIFDALEAHGWKLPQIDQYKVLDLPVGITDPAHINAFHAAVRGDVGIIIYSNTDV